MFVVCFLFYNCPLNALHSCVAWRILWNGSWQYQYAHFMLCGFFWLSIISFIWVFPPVKSNAAMSHTYFAAIQCNGFNCLITINHCYTGSKSYINVFSSPQKWRIYFVFFFKSLTHCFPLFFLFFWMSLNG